jgi:hypothetical protein
MKKLILFFLFILPLFSFAQSSYKSESEPLIGGLYMQGKCDGEIIVGSKEIAKVDIYLTPMNEYGQELNYSKSKTFYGPCFAYNRYKFSFPYDFLRGYSTALMTKIVVYYHDRTVKVYNRKQTSKMLNMYLAYIGRGYK